MKKPAKSLPDTNILVRYLIRDEETLYQRAKEFFDQVKEGKARTIILESVIAECTYVLTKSYLVPRPKAAASLIDILHYKGVANPDRQELLQALTMYSQSKLDIVDCILCAKAAAPHTALFSFDRELLQWSAPERQPGR